MRGGRYLLENEKLRTRAGEPFAFPDTSVVSAFCFLPGEEAGCFPLGAGGSLIETGCGKRSAAEHSAAFLYRFAGGGCLRRGNKRKGVNQYARKKDAVILYDAAYECFAQGDAARSIYEAEGAENCAIELCSFSKTAGFTGTRCGYTVVPAALKRNGVSLKEMWFRRQSTKTNGVSYLVQKGAAAVFTPAGEKQILANLEYYRENARLIVECMEKCGLFYTGGKNSPYVWLKCPDGMKSWEFFDYLLENAQVVGTPGSGFGANGEGYFRLTAFGSREATKEACDRIYKLLKK